MTHNKNRILMVFLVILVFTLSACGEDDVQPTTVPTPVPPSPVPADTAVPTPEPTATATVEPSPTVAPGYEIAMQYVGSWEGSWRNITFGSTGPITVETMVFPDGTAEFTVDIGGMVFGAVNPDPATYTGTYNEVGATFNFLDDPVFGEVVMTISFADSSITVTGELIPDPGIARIEATGTFTEDTVTAEYTVFFTGGGQAVGETNLTRVEE